tara:strand:+ start:264 stop:473 length:210 start_codon:yes stop_codon:yes gene_type:complete
MLMALLAALAEAVEQILVLVVQELQIKVSLVVMPMLTLLLKEAEEAVAVLVQWVQLPLVVHQRVLVMAV